MLEVESNCVGLRSQRLGGNFHYYLLSQYGTKLFGCDDNIALPGFRALFLWLTHPVATWSDLSTRRSFAV